MTMTLTQARELLEINIECNQPTFLWGPPGVGKSDMIRQIADDRGMGLIDFRCTTRDPVSLMGVPDVSGDTTVWKVPDEFPQVERDGETGILFLDELNLAPKAVQDAAYSLVLDRRVGSYVLPDGWVVMAAGNEQSHRTGVTRMSTALANRFAHLFVEPDVDAFLHWAAKNLPDPLIYAFIQFRPQLLHVMPNADEVAYPTPRSWAKLAEALTRTPEHLRMPMAMSHVGQGAAAELDGFARMIKDVPSIDMCLTDPTNAPIPSEPSGKFAVQAGLAFKVSDKTASNAFKYMERVGAEYEIAFAVAATKRNAGLSHTAAFSDYASRNSDIIFEG